MTDVVTPPARARHGLTLLVALESHLVRGPDGRIHSTTGVDGYAFWRRYLDAFDEVLVAARTDDRSETASADAHASAAPGDDSRRGADTREALAALPVVEGPGVRVVPLPEYTGPVGFVRARPRLRVALRAALAEADALCLRAPGAIAGTAWRLAAHRPFGVEVVGDPRDALAPGTVESRLRPLARALLARELRAMCRAAVAVAYVTQGALQERYPTPAWSTAYSSIDLGDEAFLSGEQIARRFAHTAHSVRGTAADPWRLICVGSLAQLYKGVDVLIDALPHLSERGIAVTLTIVGEGRHRAALETRAQALGMGAHVRFAGQVTAGGSVRQLLDHHDLFVLPSRTEGLPRALIEAMARGVPAIGTRVGGVPELLPDERLVPAGDPVALATAIARVCAAPRTLGSLALRDMAIARRYHGALLRPHRIAFYRQLRAAAEAAGRAAGEAPLTGQAAGETPRLHTTSSGEAARHAAGARA